MNPYVVLGLRAEATSKDITTAYRRLAMLWHPDRHSDADKAKAEVQFKEINAAYMLLSDPSRRSTLDQPTPRQRDHRTSSGKRPHTASRPPAPKRGTDIKVTLTIPLDVALCGGRSQVSLQDGSSQQYQAEQANNSQPCPQCAGSGMLSARSLCSRCAGRGYLKSNNSSSRSRSTSATPIFLPKNLIDGYVIKLREMGHPGQGGRYSGDLIVKIRIAAPEGWKIKGADIHGSIVVSRTLAWQGIETKVRLPHGAEARVELRPQTPSGEIIKLAQQGLYDPQARKRGDVYLRVKLERAPQVTTHI
ncbi:MAG: DnaJ C-terminal domain-containing protein [Pseudomonadota bacterium]